MVSLVPLLAASVVAASVFATSVFLNGVNIDGVRSQSFEKCRAVQVDEKGDVHLDCPGYEVKVPDPSQARAAPPTTPVAAAAAVPAVISKRYFLVTEQSAPGAAQYDIDVFVNSKWVRKLKASDDQIVMEITRLLQPGQNKLLFAATKHIEAGRKSSAASAFFKVIVGEGEQGGGNVMIDNPLLECKRTAAELDNVNEEFIVQAR